MTVRQIAEAVVIGIVVTAIPAVAWETIKIASKINAKMNADVRTSFAMESMDRSQRRAAVAIERIASAEEQRWAPLPKPSVLKKEKMTDPWLLDLISDQRDLQEMRENLHKVESR